MQETETKSRDANLEPIDHEPQGPRPLLRWPLLTVWASLAYSGTFVVVIGLDHHSLIPTSWYPPLQVLYFPFLWLHEHSHAVQAATAWFVNLFDW